MFCFFRFHVPPPKNARGAGAGELVASWRQSVELPLKFRVFNVCHAWVTRYGHELATLEDCAFLGNFIAFLEEISKVTQDAWELLVVGRAVKEQ